MSVNSTAQASIGGASAEPAKEFWGQFDGQLLDGRFPLQKYLGGFQTGAIFHSRLDGQGQQRVAVKLVSAAASDAQWLSSSWSLAQTLNHPNLVRVYATAQASLGGLRVVYAVTDDADETLESILEERSLTEAEARELLLTSASALSFLHGNGLLQSSLNPWSIVSVGESIKLLSDHLIPVTKGRDARREPGPYDAPEVATAGCSPASDVWALGATAFQALTQRLPAAAESSAMLALPPPFATILPNCLERDPGQRWLPRSIESALRGAASESAPATGAVLAKMAVPVRAPAVRGVAWWKITVASLALLLLLVAWFEKTSRRAPRNAPAIPPSASRVKPPQPTTDPPKPAPTIGKVSPFTPPDTQRKLAEESPPHAQRRSIWRVVVYTYSTAAEADRKSAVINRKWPAFHASVFSPADHPPVLVVVGGPMDRDAANHLRRQLLASGFPSDTYVNNYSR